MYIYYVFVKNQINEKVLLSHPPARKCYALCVAGGREVRCFSFDNRHTCRHTSEESRSLPRHLRGVTRDLICYDEFKDEEEDWKGLVEGGWVFGFNFFACL